MYISVLLLIRKHMSTNQVEALEVRCLLLKQAIKDTEDRDEQIEYSNEIIEMVVQSGGQLNSDDYLDI